MTDHPHDYRLHLSLNGATERLLRELLVARQNVTVDLIHHFPKPLTIRGDAAPPLNAILDAVAELRKEIKTMSGTLADQLNAALASISADVQVVSDEVGQLLALIEGQVGQPVTQEMVDAATAIDARLKAIPPAPTP